MSKIVELKEINFYYGDFKALDSINLEIGNGVHGILGPNGAGKTTLLRLLMGFLKPSSGEGTLLNFHLGSDNIRMKRKIGYMPEIDCIIPGMDGITHTAYLGELGGMPHQEAMKRAHEVLFYVGLDESRYRNVETYSTGMKQRLKLASALVHDPKLLILDEPTSGMDPKARKGMLNLIRDISKTNKMDIFISSHILDDIEMTCSQIIIINQGRVVKQDKLDGKREQKIGLYELIITGNTQKFYSQTPSVEFTKEEGNRVIAKVPEKFDLNTFFKIAKETQSQIRHLKPLRTSLKDVFVTAIGDDKNGN
jgi:ABC-2 type transport system ATP-binding protein